MTHAAATPPLWTTWPETLPRRPLCSDFYDDGVFRRTREEALERQHIEMNAAGRIAWLVFDHDGDAFESWERANLPAPNVFMHNRSKKTGHLGYALASPVGLIGASRSAPIELVADVQRGMTRRLGSDPRYCNRIAKNPASPRWATTWYSPRPYTLGELLEPLSKCDVMIPQHIESVHGLGRNCAIFADLRKWAYGNVKAARRYGDLRAWRDRLLQLALDHNSQFVDQLTKREVVGIAKSVSRWTWTRYGNNGAASRYAGINRVRIETAEHHADAILAMR